MTKRRHSRIPALGAIVAAAAAWPPAESLRALEASCAYVLEIGKEASIPARVINHGRAALKDLRVAAASDSPWLKVKLPDTFAGGGRIPEIKEEGTLETSVALAIAKGASPGAEGTVTFTFWKEEKGSGGSAAGQFGLSAPGAFAPATGALPAPGASWQVTYAVKAAPREAAEEPSDMEWHVADARRGSATNDVTIKVTNASTSQPLENVTVAFLSSRGRFCAPGDKEVAGGAAGATEVKGIEGLSVIAPGKSAEYTVSFAVSKAAKLGEVGTIRLRVQTATLGVRPNPWQPAIFVNVAPPHFGVPGNFEARLFYNLPPLPGTKTVVDPNAWIPLPQGTRILVTEVYTLSGFAGLEKSVEQIAGEGHVLDGSGFFRCQINPVEKRSPRLRIVAETAASRMEVAWQDEERAVVERMEARASRAAITPHGNQAYRCISHMFHTQIDAEATSVLPGANASGSKVCFYRPLPGQEKTFVAGEGKDVKRILIPYFGHERDLDAKRDPGILIAWEGELSTGGYVDFLRQQTPGDDRGAVSGALGHAIDVFKQLKGEDGDFAQELILSSTSPGFIYRNHNELLHILTYLVRAQEIAERLDRVTTEPPAVIACWRKDLDLAPGETGYAPREDGSWRLMVQGTLEDPDERDIGLVLRGYGAAVRRQCFKSRGGEAGDGKARPAIYDYAKRTSIEKAWGQGFDIFLAAHALGSGTVENAVAQGENQKARRSVDLDAVIEQARAASPVAIQDDRLRRIRGADNAVAVAAGLWQASKRLLPETDLLSEIFAAGGGNLGWFIELVAARRPDLIQDLVALGLCPRVSQSPQPATQGDALDPASIAVLWNANDMIAKGKLEPTIEYGAGDAFPMSPVRLAMNAAGEGGQATAAFEFGTLRDEREGAAQLSQAWKNGQTYFWRVVTKAPGGIAIAWPPQSFVAKLSTVAPAAEDRSIRFGPAGRPPLGRVDVPAEGIGSPLAVSAYSIGSVLGGRDVLGGAVYRLDLEAPAGDKPVGGAQVSGGAEPAFLKPLRLALGWRPEDRTDGATPGIFRLDEATGDWEFLGNERAGEREVRAEIRRTGTFALMIDRRKPEVSDLADAPDPFSPGPAGTDSPAGAWTLSFRLSEPATATIELADASGKPVKELAKERKFGPGICTVSWDGTNAAGATIPDGTYTYAVSSVDESGLKGERREGTVQVFRGIPGSIRGEVKIERGDGSEGATIGAAAATVRLANGTLVAESDASGAFRLTGLPPGTHRIRTSLPGYFAEERAVAIAKQGDDVGLEPIVLSRRALKDIAIEPECFTPDGDGVADLARIRFTAVRACPIEVAAHDADGNLVAALATIDSTRSDAAGDRVLIWQGLDAARQAAPSRWYEIRFGASNGEETIQQGTRKVLLDRGIVRDAAAFPSTFSPNGDGFEDALEIGYNLECEAAVTVRILDSKSELVRDVATAARQQAGWNEVSWDGLDVAGARVRDGAYAFEILPAYVTGHASKTVRGAFAADSEAPRLADMSPANGSALATGLTTFSARVVGSIDDIDRSQLKFKIDENTVSADAFDPATGILTFTPKTSLGEGVHIAIAYAQDRAGNYAPPQAVSFTVKLGAPDRERPRIADLVPERDATVYAAAPLIFARFRDLESGIDPATIALTLNGDRVAGDVRYFIPGKSGKPWDWYSYTKAIVLYDPLQGEARYVPLEPLAEGKHHLTIDAFDRAANRAARAETVFTVVIDAQPPVASVVSPRNGALLADAKAAVLSARIADEGKSGLDLASLRVAIDCQEVAIEKPERFFDAKEGLFSLPLPTTLAAGAQHVAVLTARDRAGNLSAPAVTVFGILSDPDPPRIELLSSKVTGAALSFSAAVYDVGRSGLDEGSVRLELDGTPVPPDRPETAAVEGFLVGGGLVRMTFERLERGDHVLALGARDRAGNAAQELTWQAAVR